MNVLVIVPLLVALLALVLKVTKILPRIYAFISWKRSTFIAILYLVVLVLLIPLVYLLPDKGFLKSVETASQDPAAFHINPQELVVQGNLDQKSGLYKNSSQSFTVDSQRLSFQKSSNNYQIYVKQKAVDDGKIDVATYVGTHRAGGIDYTKMVKSPEILLENGVLSIQAEKQRLDFKQFTTEFTINQFKQTNPGFNHGMVSAFGWEIVYVAVPKSLEIQSGNNVQIIR